MSIHNTDAEDRSDLTNDALAAIGYLVKELETDEEPDPEDFPDDVPPQMQAMAMMDHTTMLRQVRPQMAAWMERNPERLREALAVLHLETGALLDKHCPESDPEDLV